MNDKDLEGGAQELLEDTDPLTDWSDWGKTTKKSE
jgi:hypothetical protein